MKKDSKYAFDLRRYGNKIEDPYLHSFFLAFRGVTESSYPIMRILHKIRYRILSSKHAIEISPYTRIDKGLYIGHPYNITINEDSIIGKNCCIHKGVLIGRENRGVRKGAPIIGDEVWIGINAAIVGHIRIGNDVLIAPNSYVNCDIPDHSVVFGNPIIIVHREHATEAYINNKVE